MSAFSLLLINPSINSANLFALMEPYTHHLHLHLSHLTPAPSHFFKFFIFVNSLLHHPSSISIHPAHSNTSRRTLSFPHFLAFFPNSRCWFDRRIIASLPDPSTDAHGRSVRPSSTYHPRFINKMNWIEELTWKVQSFYRDFPLKLRFAKTNGRKRRAKRDTQELVSIP